MLFLIPAGSFVVTVLGTRVLILRLACAGVAGYNRSKPGQPEIPEIPEMGGLALVAGFGLGVKRTAVVTEANGFNGRPHYADPCGGRVPGRGSVS